MIHLSPADNVFCIICRPGSAPLRLLKEGTDYMHMCAQGNFHEHLTWWTDHLPVGEAPAERIKLPPVLTILSTEKHAGVLKGRGWLLSLHLKCLTKQNPCICRQADCHATLPSHHSDTSDTCRVLVWRKLHLYTVTVHGQDTARELAMVMVVMLCFSRCFSTKWCEKWDSSSRTAAGLQGHKSTTQYPYTIHHYGCTRKTLQMQIFSKEAQFWS